MTNAINDNVGRLLAEGDIHDYLDKLKALMEKMTPTVPSRVNECAA